LEHTPKLYLIPTPLGNEQIETMPQAVIDWIHELDVFIVERAKTARHFIKRTKPSKPISALHVFELDKHDPTQDRVIFKEAFELGKDVGFLSEAGCPGVADPGSSIVQMAHLKGIPVVPLVGPSSIVLALMASGMNGQNFAFQGYLTPKKEELPKALKRLEQLSTRHNQTQIFIETPYRNQNLVKQVLTHLTPGTRFCIAADLTLPSEYIRTLRIKDWKNQDIPDLHKRPAIFLIHG